MNKNKTSGIRGKAGEDAVCQYLKDKGFRIRARNFRRSCGEIDIISEAGEYLIFTEVKTRKFGAVENGTGAMTKAKMKRIIGTAELFVASNPDLRDYYRRFDTAYVTVTSENPPCVLDLEYFEGDFTAGDCF